MANVKLLNPAEVADLYKNWGKFSAVCYDTDCTDEGYVRIGKHCHESGHYSGSRAYSFIFEITDVSRVATAQMNRHSVGVTVNEKSMRYCDNSGNGIVIPDAILNNEDAFADAVDILNLIAKFYEGYKGEIKGEDLRYMLPLGSTSSGVYGFTLEALENFIQKRLCKRSQAEIRNIADQMLELVDKIDPDLTKNMYPPCALGGCKEKVKC